MGVKEAEHFKTYLSGSLAALMEQLANNYMDEKDRDVSLVIRGRIYMLKDILDITGQLDSYDKMKRELVDLEGEGYKTKEPVV